MTLYLKLAVGIVAASALLSAVSTSSQSGKGSQARFLTSSGGYLNSLFEGVSPTQWGKEVIRRYRMAASGVEQSSHVDSCQTGKRAALGLKENLGGARLIPASCFTGSCAGHYVVFLETLCAGKCDVYQYQVDHESGDPNEGEVQEDINCGGVCCNNYDSCFNQCDPENGCF